jgi:hypothetical protein
VISLGQLALPDSDVLVVPWMSFKKTPEHIEEQEMVLPFPRGTSSATSAFGSFLFVSRGEWLQCPDILG